MPFDIIVGRDEADLEKFGKTGLIYIGKGYVKMGQRASLSNPILIDVARSHVILITGKRGSGKSYTLGVIAEEITKLPKEISSNIAPLIFDTMGVYWSSKYANEKDVELLRQWGLEPQKLPVRVFVPYKYFSEYEEQGIPVDFPFSINAHELETDDWLATFKLDFTNPIAILIERVLEKLKEKNKNYSIKDILKEIEEDKETEKESKSAAKRFFEAASTWGIFAEQEEGTKISQIVEGGKTTVLDLSKYSSIGTFNIRALVIGIISKKLFNERMFYRKKEEIQAVQHGLEYLRFKEEREMPLVWILIDEVHEFLPKTDKTAATDALIQLLREGRQPGISLVMATQQPGVLHRDAITQSDIIISHRVTARPDIESLNDIMQSYMLGDIKTQLDSLPKLKGSAIVLDDNSERIYPIRVRPRFTWHGGEAPTSVKVEKRL